MAFDAFMYVEGGKVSAQGETTDDEFSAKKAWEIFSFSCGASNPTTVGSGSTGLAAGKVSISSFNIMKKLDNSSPSLFHACCSGSFWNSATVILRKAGGDKQMHFLQYDFKNVYVESIQWSGSSGGDDTPTESVSFSFAAMQVTYWPQNKDGSQGTKNPAAWDVTTNKATYPS